MGRQYVVDLGLGQRSRPLSLTKAIKTARAASLQHPGDWVDVVRGGITYFTCLRGVCYEGKGDDTRVNDRGKALGGLGMPKRTLPTFKKLRHTAQDWVARGGPREQLIGWYVLDALSELSSERRYSAPEIVEMILDDLSGDMFLEYMRDGAFEFARDLSERLASELF